MIYDTAKILRDRLLAVASVFALLLFVLVMWALSC